MDIGIIGAGRIGGSLTRRLTGLGHGVRVSNSRAPETLADLIAETGASAAWAAEAAADADLVIVIVSIPQKNVVDLAPGYRRHGEDRRAGDRDQQLLPEARPGSGVTRLCSPARARWVRGLSSARMASQRSAPA